MTSNFPSNDIDTIISLLEENDGKFFDMYTNSESICTGYMITKSGRVAPLFKGNHTLNPLSITRGRVVSGRGTMDIIMKSGEDYKAGMRDLEKRSPGFLKSYKIFDDGGM